MNFSARKASRKWPCEGFGRTFAAMVTVATVLLMLCAQTEPAAARKHGHSLWGDLFGETRPKLRETRPKPRRQAALPALPASVPLPQPRPADAPVVEPEKPAAAKQPPAEVDKPAEQAASPPLPQPRPADAPAEQPASPPPRSACRLALTDAIAIAPSIPDIKGPGDCGGEDLVRLEAVVLPDKRRVSLKPAATFRCPMATAVADWIRTDMAPLAASRGSVISDLDNFDSFDCRGRNGVTGAKLSEHGHANALDVRGLKLANGQSISLTDRTVSRELRESVLHSVCARFSTVLGPGSDGYHEEHIHLDLMERHNNYKICQWDVWDPLPQIAPLLPLERPEEAPPREVVAKSDATKSDAAKPDADKSEAARPDTGKSDAAKSDAAKSNVAKPDAAKPNAAKSDTTKSDAAEPRSGETRPPTKKRRENRRF
ncbi:MAG TPA: extensin family protein [Bradyrhizobium sp.]|nr:extensin family protein [Bradyrhizobium sp.]